MKKTEIKKRTMKRRVMKKRVKRLKVVLLVVFLYGISSIYTSLWKSFKNNTDNEENKKIVQKELTADKDKEKKTEVSTVKEKTKEANEEINDVPILKENTEKESKDVFSNSTSKTNKYIFPSEEPVRAKPGKDKFLVKVSISKQKVHIYKNESEIKTMACSTGLPGKDKETPIGKYKINDYFGQSFYSDQYKQGARYWVGFIGPEFLFHSVPTSQNGQVIPEEADKIGSRASHGCVRLEIEDSFWFYETVPKGADVIIEA